MNYFQMLGLGIVCVCLIVVLCGRRQRNVSLRATIGWVVLWICAGIAITYPRITVIIAKLLGIGRGADLVFYCAIVIGMLAVFYIYLKLRKIESAITTIVSHLSLRNNESNKSQSPPKNF